MESFGAHSPSSARLNLLVLDFLRRDLPVQFEVTGQSMYPFLRNHDLVEVHPVREGEPVVGDIVVLSSSEARLLVHRVIRTGGEEILTRGDAMPGDDGWMKRHVLAGRVRGISRAGRPRQLGLGPEGRWIAMLSRTGISWRFFRLAARLNGRLLQEQQS